MRVAPIARTIARLATLIAAVSSTACVADASDVRDDEHTATTEQAITNGTDDDADPAVVALLLDGNVLCTGFLVSSHVVITAGHCVDQVQPDTVYFGSDPRSKKGRFIKVADSQTHPDYDPATLVSDVGIIGLAEAASVKPLPVQVKPFDDSFVGMSVRLVGFGARQGGGDLALRKHVGTSKLTNYAPQDFRFVGAPSQTCEGDSGGPALATIDGKEVVIGITSSGDTDCKKYGVDMRMDVFVPWFANYTKAYKAPPSTDDAATSSGCSIASTTRSHASGAAWLVALSAALAICARRRARSRA